MQALDWLWQYEFARRALVTGVAVGMVCSLLSVVVVLKRMAFIGQGISHAGFGGVGTAVLLGLNPLAQDAVIFVFCVLTALAIGVLAKRPRIERDSAIGILLAATMAWGVFAAELRGILRTFPWFVEWFGAQTQRNSYELLLSGSLLSVSEAEMWMAVILSAMILLICCLLFKEILFFSFDETVSGVFGVPHSFMHYLLLIVLSMTIVLSVKLVGFVLVSALLVIPGATALLLSRRLAPVLAWTMVLGLVGVVGGLLISLEFGRLSIGPCIVGVLCMEFMAGLMFRPRRPVRRTA